LIYFDYEYLIKNPSISYEYSILYREATHVGQVSLAAREAQTAAAAGKVQKLDFCAG
jgi:hypothetical protein